VTERGHTELDNETERALTDLVMNCPELVQLEALLSRFNIFRVLKAEHHEIRHSNMLAWLFDPDETHGLGDRFLRRFLMRVVHDAETGSIKRLDLPSPIEIDSLDIEYVEVARESDNIDLLLVIRLVSGAPLGRLRRKQGRIGSTYKSASALS
jgi:PD-(D/E)XK nuclease superfamily